MSKVGGYDVDVYYEDSGVGPETVVLVHGEAWPSIPPAACDALVAITDWARTCWHARSVHEAVTSIVSATQFYRHRIQERAVILP